PSQRLSTRVFRVSPRPALSTSIDAISDRRLIIRTVGGAPSLPDRSTLSSGPVDLLPAGPGAGGATRTSAVAGTFLAIGGFSLVLLVLALVGGGRLHLGHLHLGHFHLGHWHIGHLHAGGAAHAGQGSGGGRGIELSAPVISGFLGAFGFG